MAGQNVYFFLNHPIRYVSIVAPVVAIQNIEERYGLLTLDDASGATVVAKLNLLDKSIYTQMDCPSNTVISNVTFRNSLGNFDIDIDGTLVDIGTVVKAKCTLEFFRGTMQLVLQRISIAKTTSEEVKAWKEIAQWKTGVLSQPWRLSAAELELLQKQESSRLEKLRHNEQIRRERQKRKKANENAKRQKRVVKQRLRELAMNEGALI
jgi:Telomere regulation protein Stn1